MNNKNEINSASKLYFGSSRHENYATGMIWLQNKENIVLRNPLARLMT